MRKSETQLVGAFEEALRITDPDPEKRKKPLSMRLVGLGFGEACSRCGGTGHYSSCAMYGTVCFRCAGAREAAPTLTNRLLEAVREKVAEGALEVYFARNRRRAEAKRAVDAVMAAWQGTGISARYDWRKTRESREDRRVCDLNARMCAAYEATSNAASALKIAETLHGALSPEAEAASERVRAAKADALAAIAAAASEMDGEREAA